MLQVTRDDALRAKVVAMCEQVGNRHYKFVSCPEVILGAMAQATIRQIRRISNPEQPIDFS